jgi:hypothetical protein
MIDKLWDWLFGPSEEIHFFCGYRRRDDGKIERYVRSAVMLIDSIEGPSVFYGEEGPLATKDECELIVREIRARSKTT